MDCVDVFAEGGDFETERVDVGVEVLEFGEEVRYPSWFGGRESSWDVCVVIQSFCNLNFISFAFNILYLCRSVFLNTVLIQRTFKIRPDPSSPIDELAFTKSASTHQMLFTVKLYLNRG